MTKAAKTSVAAILTTLAALLLPTTPALAADPPQWSVAALAQPGVFQPGDEGDLITLRAANTGNMTASGEEGSLIAISAVLPEGLTVIAIEGVNAGSGNQELFCSTITLSCITAGLAIPGDVLVVKIRVNVAAEASGPLSFSASASGGGAAPAFSSLDIPVGGSPAAFGIAPNSFGFIPSNTQAGGHPNLTASFSLNEKGVEEPSRAPRDIGVDLPPGVLGNPTVTPRCDMARVLSNTCPRDSAVGVATISLAKGIAATELVYNIAPSPNEPAAFAFNLLFPVRLDTALIRNPEGEYRIHVIAKDTTEAARFTDSSVTLWGIPSEHNGLGPNVTTEAGGNGVTFFGGPGGGSRLAFLTSPTACLGTLSAAMSLTSWPTFTGEGTTIPASEDSATTPIGPFTGCDQLSFAPTFTLRPDTTSADSSAGVGFDLKIPQNENPDAIATPNLRDATVTLPKGLVVNPASADGLQGCTAAQIDLASSEPATCPDGAQIGSVQAKTPLLSEPLTGQVYLGTPNCSPCSAADAQSGSLLHGYIQLEGSGVRVKLPGSFAVDPATSQITASFKDNPQAPLSELKLTFKGGPRGTLTTPNACGTYTTTADFKPWSAPDSGPDALASDDFQINSGPNGGACVSNDAQRALHPGFSAGTLTPIAGHYSPFALGLTRQDGEQELSSIDTILPPGLVGKLAGIPYCPEAAISTAASRSAAVEKVSPSCPAASKVGSVTVGAGAGSHPFYVGGSAYLAGPYKGAPLSMAIITPALAGPFDLGVVVVRAALRVDPETARITVVSDPLPRSLAGIPLQIRDVRVNVDKPDFTLNPTNCDPLTVGGTVFGSDGATANLSNPFQVGACGALGFKPKLAISLKGGTRRSQHPALKSVLTYPKGDYANIAKAAVTLPAGEFIDNARIGSPCLRPQFNEEKCPKKSLLGTARAFSPLLDKPLEGNVYFRSNGGERELPDLVADLKGQIHIVLVGYVDAVHRKGSEESRVRTTFATVPDAPVSKFIVQLKGGKEGLLVNSGNLCEVPDKAMVKLTAQNGKVYDTKPVVANSCGSGGKKGRQGR